MMTVRQARMFRDLSQQQVADALNVNVDTYRRIERNPQKATIEMAIKFCSVVNMKMDDIFFGNNSTFGRNVVESGGRRHVKHRNF